jgi:hypothetical protein
MTDIPLGSLNLESRWPKLAALQNEIADLEKRLHRARGAVHAAQGQLAPARERDLNEAGRAIRARKAVPEPEHEPKVQAELEAADRATQQVNHALREAREDLGAFLAAHQSALYRDVREARNDVAREAAEAAQAALASYSRYEEMRRVVKALTPAEQPDENAPAARLTNSFALTGIHTRQLGPARGDIEAALRYVANLAPEDSLGSPSQEAGGDAAA